MPLPIPNVPIFPGVPALPSSGIGLAAFPSIVLLTADTIINFITGTFGPQWGIFLDGDPVVLADSVVTFDYKQDWSVPTYPVEQGGFESYDKVELPFEVRLRFATGGSQEDRQAFIDSIAAIAGDFNLYDAVTPEEVYTSVNVTHYDYHRAAEQGAGLVVVDVWLTEIRDTASATFSQTQQPSGATPVGQGNVQTQTPAPQVTQSITSAMEPGEGFANGGTSW